MARVREPGPSPNPADAWGGEPVAELAARWRAPRVEAYEWIGSTNDRAAELARQGAPALTTVLADTQGAGRGRRGSTWHCEPGAGLLMSVVLPRVESPGVALPLLVGLAVAEAIEGAGGPRPLLKWPNDVLLAGRKVAGVLCERTADGVVAGMGVNLRAPAQAWPVGLRGVAVAVEELAGVAPDRNVVCEAVLDGFRRWVLGAGAAAGALSREAWEALGARDALRGRRIESETGGRGVGGGIGADGALLLTRDDGSEVRVVAGGVTLVS